MQATIAICTYNKVGGIGAAVRCAAAQDISDFEVLVVDDGSHRGADVKHTAQLSGARYVRQPHGGLNAARNTAMESARSDLVTFIDDDVEVPVGWIRAFVEGAFRHPRAGVFGGPVLLRVEGQRPRMCEREGFVDTHLDPLPEGPTDAILGGNMLVRRDAYEETGPFDDRLSGPNDESEWVRRVRSAGFEIVHLPDAWVWHVRTEHDFKLPHLLRKSFRYGRASALADRIMGEPVAPGAVLASIPRYVAHAAKERCWAGLFMATRSAGFATGALQRSRPVEHSAQHPLQ